MLAMRQKRKLHRWRYKAGKWLDPISGIGLVVLTSVLELDPATYEDWPWLLPKVTGKLQEISLFLWLTLAVFALVGWYLRWRGDPWIWVKLQNILDQFQSVAYRDFQGELKDHHRVTLFRYKRWCFRMSTPMTDGVLPWKKGRFPWSGWLVPVIRSGNTSQNTNAVFLAPDIGENAEGVAGYAWASNSTSVVTSLPNIQKTTSEAQIEKYANRTFCPQPIVRSYADADRRLPRSIGAIPIEVNNEAWGVLVLDSRDPNGVTEGLITNFTLAAFTIGQLLERAK